MDLNIILLNHIWWSIWHQINAWIFKGKSAKPKAMFQYAINVFIKNITHGTSRFIKEKKPTTKIGLELIF